MPNNNMEILTVQDNFHDTHRSLKNKYNSLKRDLQERIKKLCAQSTSNGVFSCMAMGRAGFRYTGEVNTTICDDCQLEVSQWTQTMIPFDVHAERNPQCPFVLSRLNKSSEKSSDSENTPKRHKIESYTNKFKQDFKLIELEKMKQVRRRTFSHWQKDTQRYSEQMIAAGFFACNVSDRVICLYCDIICQEWTTDIDDPLEVHKTLSPQCPYVLAMLTHPQSSLMTTNLNDIPIDTININTEPEFDQTIHTSSCHPFYSEMTKRLESFDTCLQERSVSVEEFARAGFFYSDSNDITKCFNCNGTLSKLNSINDPLMEHIRLYPLCDYAKQVGGDEYCRKIREEQRTNRENDRTPATFNFSLISRYVAARVDLFSSQNLLDRYFKLSVIKRCWEDQLQVKQDDFLECVDLFTSCTILQRQIDVIQGNKDNIINVGQRMKMIREGNQSNMLPTTKRSTINQTTPAETEPITAISSIEPTITKEIKAISEIKPASKKSLVNPCAMCRAEEKQLAAIPCGHFITCIECSQTLRICPQCQKEIAAYVRIYI
ncbi:hypothetical protein I4U23_001261 [Adineta vaga]|nr:hypothetical protein I4U23_001261 [Adineta vaga]